MSTPSNPTPPAPSASGQVPMTATPLAPSQAMAVLDAALPPGHTRAGLNLVAAQSALETAWWGSKTGQGFYNYNFGNVTPSGSQPWWSTPTIAGMRYRAFSGAADGAAAMVAWLSQHNALTAASAGDLTGYMAALRAGGYLGVIGRTDATGHTVSQADYDAYQRGIASIMASLANVNLPGGSVA